MNEEYCGNCDKMTEPNQHTLSHRCSECNEPYREEDQ